LLANVVAAPVDAFTTLSSKCVVPSASTARTIFVPSGDQLGVYTWYVGSYRIVVPEPSASLR
jgi:hypothetical protein